MATFTAIPVEEYLRTTYHPDREYVDGQLVERHVGEYLHSRLQGLILALLISREPESRFRTFPELRIKVSEQPRYRIPGVSVKALPHEMASVLVRPDFAIEIVSPGDEVAGALAKIGDYMAAGIPHIWVVDPNKRTLTEADGAGIRGVATLKVSTPLVGGVDFAQLFEQLNEPPDWERPLTSGRTGVAVPRVSRPL